MCLVSAREEIDYDVPARKHRHHHHKRHHYREYSSSPPRSVRAASRHSAAPSRHSDHYSRRTSRTKVVEEGAPPTLKSEAPPRSERSAPRSVATWIPPPPPDFPDIPPIPPAPSVVGGGTTRHTSVRGTSRAPSVRSEAPNVQTYAPGGRRVVYESSRFYDVEVEREFTPPPPTPPPPTPPRDPTPPPPPSSSSSSSSSEEVQSSHHTVAPSVATVKSRKSATGTEYSMHEREYRRYQSARQPRDQFETYRYVNAPRVSQRYEEPPRSNRGDWEERELIVDDNGRKTKVKW